MCLFPVFEEIQQESSQDTHWRSSFVRYCGIHGGETDVEDSTRLKRLSHPIGPLESSSWNRHLSDEGNEGTDGNYPWTSARCRPLEFLLSSSAHNLSLFLASWAALSLDHLSPLCPCYHSVVPSTSPSSRVCARHLTLPFVYFTSRRREET